MVAVQRHSRIPSARTAYVFYHVLKCLNFNSRNVEDQVKENEVGRAYGTHGREQKSVQRFNGKARRK
jgi:hypothetical protein